MANSNTIQSVAVGEVRFTQGEVFAKSADGNMRRLAVGDQIFEGEVIVTASGSSAEINMFNGTALNVGEQQSVAVDSQVASPAHDATAGAVSDLGSTEAAKVVQTVSADDQQDFNVLLEEEAAAAGLTGGDGGGGSSFVDLVRIVENVPTTGYDFPINPTGTPPVIEGQAGVPPVAAETPIVGILPSGEVDARNAVDNDVLPTIGDDQLSVSEEGLTDGNKDATGIGDTTDLATRTGTISITGNGTAALTAELSLTGLPSLQSGGVSVVWSYGANHAIILGKANGVDVIQITLNGGSTSVNVAGTTPPSSLSYEVKLLGPVDHPQNSVENTLGFSVGVTLSDGANPTASGAIEVTIEDDMPVLTSIESLVVANAVASTTGDIAGLSFGADGEAAAGGLVLTGWPNLAGITHTLAADGKTLTATINGDNNAYDGSDAVFYSVALNNNGTYTFDLVTPQPTKLIPLDFGQVPPGSPKETVTLTTGANSVTFDGLQFDPTTFAPINSTGSNVDDINPNNIGFGLGNGNIGDNEGFVASVTAPVDGMQFTVVGQAGNVDATTIYWNAYDATGTVVDSGSVSLTGLKSVAPSQVVNIQSDVEFSSIQVRFDHPDSNDVVRIQDFSLIDKIVPPELTLNFTATATDSDGDLVAASFSVNVDSVLTAVDDNAYVTEGQVSATNDTANATEGYWQTSGTVTESGTVAIPASWSAGTATSFISNGVTISNVNNNSSQTSDSSAFTVAADAAHPATVTFDVSLGDWHTNDLWKAEVYKQVSGADPLVGSLTEQSAGGTGFTIGGITGTGTYYVKFTVFDNTSGPGNSGKADLTASNLKYTAYSYTPATTQDFSVTAPDLAWVGGVVASGNVMSNDNPGSEGAVVATVGSTTVLSAGTTDIAGAYGTLHMSASGAYTYTPDTIDHTAGATDTFTYTLKQPDGDTATATLTVSIADHDYSSTSNNANFVGGEDGNDTLSGQGGNDIVYGGAGNDTLNGDAGNDHLVGGAGNDTLNGGTGTDILEGGTGDNVLIGGAGDDVMTGGSGADTFIFRLADIGTEAVPAIDTVKGFGIGDALDLSDVLSGGGSVTFANESSTSADVRVYVGDGVTPEQIIHIEFDATLTGTQPLAIDANNIIKITS